VELRREAQVWRADLEEIVGVVGYLACWYRNNTAEKIKPTTQNDTYTQTAVVTRFLDILKRRPKGVLRIAFSTPYQLERLVDWCRGMPGFTSK